MTKSTPTKKDMPEIVVTLKLNELTSYTSCPSASERTTVARYCPVSSGTQRSENARTNSSPASRSGVVSEVKKTSLLSLSTCSSTKNLSGSSNSWINDTLAPEAEPKLNCSNWK